MGKMTLIRLLVGQERDYCPQLAEQLGAGCFPWGDKMLVGYLVAHEQSSEFVFANYSDAVHRAIRAYAQAFGESARIYLIAETLVDVVIMGEDSDERAI